MRARVYANVVARNLRELDFGDRIDEVICQPRDIERLLAGLKGLQKVSLSGRHAARYSGTVEEHVEFCLERARKECVEVEHGRCETPAEEFRRMALRSPVTDGSRMMISPGGFEGRWSGSGRVSGGGNVSRAGSVASGRLTWVVVDLSMLMWKHYL